MIDDMATPSSAARGGAGGDAGSLEHDLAEVDPQRQQRFLVARHVDRLEPCNSCWARYLCSGGCHQEAPARTDASCQAIRDWLDFCLDAYCALTAARPEWFGDHHGNR